MTVSIAEGNCRKDSSHGRGFGTPTYRESEGAQRSARKNAHVDNVEWRFNASPPSEEDPPWWIIGVWLQFLFPSLLTPSTFRLTHTLLLYIYCCAGLTGATYVVYNVLFKVVSSVFRKRRRVLEEQLGIRLPSFVTPDFVARETTLLLALKTSLQNTTSKAGVVSALVSYAQAHSSKSLLGHLMSFAKPNCDDWDAFITEDVRVMVEQSGEDERQWIENLKGALSNWKKYRQNKDIKNVLKLLNYVVSLGMCEASNLTFKMGKLTMFEPVVYKQQIECTDLIDLFATTAIGFIEGGWRVYKTGEISAFFEHDEEMTKFESLYNKIRDVHGFSLTGNLKEHANITETDYELLLDEAVELGDKLTKKINRTMTIEKKFLMDRLDKIRDWRNEFIQVRTRGGLRKAPFAISLFGNTCVGKSTLNKLTYEAIGEYNGIDVSDERVATWADNDKYASNIRSSTNVIVFDDFGNTSPSFMDFSPVYRLIQTINNALFLAPMAEAFMKGKVALHPWIVMVTTNVEHLLAEKYSEKPESVLRRLFHVKVLVKEEFQTNGKLDSRKVEAKFGMKREADIWTLTVRECVVGEAKFSNSNKNMYELRPIEFEGQSMEGVDLYRYLKWAQVASKDHYDYQAKLVEMNTVEKSKCCTKCGFAFCGCEKEEGVDRISRLPTETDETILPAERTFDEEVNTLRVLLGIPKHEEQASPLLRAILRNIFWYCVGYTLGVVFHFVIAILQLPSESRIPTVKFLFAWARNYLIAWRDKFRRTTMWNLYYFARWQRQKRWNMRAFFYRLHVYTTEDLLALENWYNDSIFDWVAWVPESFITSPWVTHSVLYARRYEILNRKWKVVFLYLYCLSVCVLWIIKGWYLSAIVVFYCIVCCVSVIYYWEKSAIREELLSRNDNLPKYVKMMKEHSCKIFVGSAISLYFLSKWLYTFKKIMTPQGNLNPQTMEDIEERDNEGDPWAEHFITPIPMSTASKTTDHDDLVRMCGENLVYVQSPSYYVRGFMIESNFMIIPAHFVKRHWNEGYEDIPVHCWRRNPKVVGGNFRETLGSKYTYIIPNTDFAICWTPSSGSMGDMRRFLPTGIPSDSEASFVLKGKDATISVSKTYFKRELGGICHTSMNNIPGGFYKLPFETADGMCMSPLVSKGRGAAIIGFHLCGEGTEGGCGYVTQDEVERGLQYLEDVPGVVRTCNKGTLPTHQFGKRLIESTEVHYKSATRFVTPGCSLEVFGTTSGKSTPHSSVEPTIISKIVEDETGVPQQWGPPKLKGEGVYPFQVALEQLAHPSQSLGSIVVRAVKCYRLQFIKIYQKLPKLFTDCKPLTRVQTVSGIKGKRFIDAMNFNTSPGWPLSGKKTKLLVELDPDEYFDVGRPRTFTPEIWEDVERIKEVLMKRERAYCVWKACLKDESTELTKDKVRVFQSAPIALQILIRMYFLPIVRIIQLNPLLTECMVGANAEGPEWEQLNSFMTSKGENVLAGDYSKYDQRMPAQLVTAAFSILIWVAQTFCSYSDEDICLMKAIVAEVIYPLMAYNGDLLMLFGSNPSGQNLTVIINSIVNSLLLRSCYYTVYAADKTGTFTDFCAFGTYGDDVKGTVSPAKPKFNHISFAQFLAKYDMKFTMPDKESVATEYMEAGSADFLKRSDFYHPDLQAHVGVLCEKSIFKRLHSHVRSKELTLEQQAAQNIDSSLHDWFYYGRDKFELRRAQMYNVAKRAGLLHLCQGLDVTYDERVQRWLRKYRPESADPVVERRVIYKEN